MVDQWMGIEIFFDLFGFRTIREFEPADQCAIQIFLNSLVKLFLIKGLIVLKTQHDGDVDRVFFKFGAEILEPGRFSALPGRKYGKVPAHVDHGFYAPSLRIDDIFQVHEIGCVGIDRAEFGV